jgi:hypothetical protein
VSRPLIEPATGEAPESEPSGTQEEPIGGPGSTLFRLALATFCVLALELATIRWMSGQVRIFAYFNNLVLIGTILGMGLGIAIGRRRPELYHRFFPALFVFALVVGTASITGLSGLSFPDVSIHLWGAQQTARMGSFVLNLLLVLALFWGVVTVFALASTAVGHFFGRGNTLASYSFDLLGSLLGVLAFAVVTSLGVGPAVWFAVACVPFPVLAPG